MSNLGVRSLRTGPADGALWKTALTDLSTDVNALATEANALVTDVASIRTNYNLTRTDVSNARATANALVTDATAIRTTANAAVADLTSLYTSANAMITDFWGANGINQNRVTQIGTVAPATTAGKVKTTTQCTYLLANSGFQKAITDNLWDLTLVTTAANGFAKVLLLLDNAGAATILKGTESTVSQAAAVFPAVPANKTCAGWVQLGNSYAGGALTSAMCFDGSPFPTTAAAPTAQTSAAAAAMTAAAAAAIGSAVAAAATATATTAATSFTDAQ